MNDSQGEKIQVGDLYAWKYRDPAKDRGWNLRRCTVSLRDEVYGEPWPGGGRAARLSIISKKKNVEVVRVGTKIDWFHMQLEETEASVRHRLEDLW